MSRKASLESDVSVTAKEVLGLGARRGTPGRNKTIQAHLMATEEASSVGTEGVVNRKFHSPSIKQGFS